MKKLMIFFGVLVIGAIIALLIDKLVGINDVDSLALTIHRLTYLVWGGIIFKMLTWLRDR